MATRLDYSKLAPEGMAKLTELGHYLNTQTGLEPVLLDLVRLRASLMNGCEYCIQLHTAELKKLHEPEERIAGLSDWRGSNAYTQRERAALVWTEAVTNIQEGHAPDEVYAQVREHFSEVETVNLTLAITTINTWNRLAIALGDYPGHAGGGGEVNEEMTPGLKPLEQGADRMSGLKPGPTPERQLQVQMRGFFTPFRMTTRKAGAEWGQ
jgi:AhpD family alkylhydroperoxidase